MRDYSMGDRTYSSQEGGPIPFGRRVVGLECGYPGVMHLIVWVLLILILLAVLAAFARRL